MKRIEAHKHYWWGENHQHFDGEETIIKMSYPRVFIRYKLSDAYFADFDEFYNSIAEVQWFDGDEVSEKKKMEIFIEAWNFLAIEERLLEEDLKDMDDEMD
jgi:hypothetical protein